MPKNMPSPLALRSADGRIELGTFLSLATQREYIDRRTGERWPAKMIDTIFAPIVPLDAKGHSLHNANNKVEKLRASEWLDRYHRVDQQVWAPGEPEIIVDRALRKTGWRTQTGARCFNLYDPPEIEPGDPTQATPWLELVRKVYPDDADHIIKWLACKVQNPGVKINHALVLGGSQGIGKDTILEPIATIVGPGNFNNISPTQLISAFNSFVMSVVLQVDEARDQGENTRVNRYSFYDHSKTYTAESSTKVIRCNEKHQRATYVFNVLGLVYTTNYRFDGLYLPADDRRHYIAWSELTKADFVDDYWTELRRWYRTGGTGHVAAYLRSLDLTSFNPKAPPPRTKAMLDIIDVSAAPENSELADAIDELNADRKDGLTLCTLRMIAATTKGAAMEWLLDRKSRRTIPHRMADIWYIPVRNPDEKDGRWRVNGVRQVIYAPVGMAPRERDEAARKLVLVLTESKGSS
jgi:Family of unknown function (DUF5906)